jgi:cobalt/nickel transport system ATP-binding protein
MSGSSPSGSSTAAPLIEVSGLSFRYDDGGEALRGVDFQLFPGETVAILGRNGSGKTTFLLHLNGILRGEGAIRVCGLPLETAHLPVIRRKIGFLFQDPEEQLFLPTLIEDVAFGPLQTGREPAEAVEIAARALASVGFDTKAHQRAPWRLSAGEKQRAALAGLLATGPEILVLDEPTTHLDPPARRQLAELLASLPQARILVTHDTPFARRLATRAVFFEQGRIAAEGSVDEIVQDRSWDL